MASLGVPFQLFPDEALTGALYRIAGSAGYIISQQLVEAAGFKYLRLESIAGKDPAAAAAAFAELIGADVAHVAPHFHQAFGDGTCEFFGTRIRSKHRDISTRRVAPRALKQGNYVRALWQLKCFSFDPRSLETLLSECPGCGAPLDYLRALGVSHCSACRVFEYGLPRPVVDLRDFPQPVLEVSDREGLDFLTDLIDPNPEVRDNFSVNLHDDLRNLSRGEIFEFALALSCVSEQDPKRSATTIARPTTREGYALTFTPDRLAKAARIVMHWPAGFDQLCETAREGLQDRGGFFGVKAELGKVYALKTDRSLTEATRAVAKAAIARNMSVTAGSQSVRRVEFRSRTDLITTQDAGLKYSIHGKQFPRLAKDDRLSVHRSAALTGPVLFREDQIAEIAGRRGDLEAISSVGIRLGIPPTAVRKIATVGLIDAETGPVLHLMTGKEYFRRSSVDRLIERVRFATKPHPGGCRYSRLTKSMNSLPAGDKPWSEVIQAIVDGHLEVFEIEGRLDAVFIKLATRTHADVLAVLKDHAANVGSPERRITQGEAAGILGTTPFMISSLATSGRLPSDGLTLGHAHQVGRDYIFVPELARRLRTSARRVRARLALSGVHPLHQAAPDRGLVYSRRQVDELFGRASNE